MKSAPACIPCLLGQVLRVAREVAQDDWLHRKVLEEVMGTLPGTDWSRPPAELLAENLGSARKVLRAQDPFMERRREVLRDLRSLAAEVWVSLEGAPDRFALAVKAAAAANVVDALALGSFDVAAAFRAVYQKGFAQGSPSDLEAAVKGAENVLYLLDNAGEAAFDLLLVEEIRRLGKPVTVAARRPGLLHDATLEDAREAGHQEPLLDTGQDGLLGSTPVLAGPEFRAAFEAASLVVSKGSAGFETLSGERKEIFHLLHVKCEPVAQALGASAGDLVLLRA